MSKVPSAQPDSSASSSIEYWYLYSPSTHKYGRRLILYDIFASFGRLEWFKTFTIISLWILLAENGRLHNVLNEKPSLIFNVRITAFIVILSTFFFEIMEAIGKMKLAE